MDKVTEIVEEVFKLAKGEAERNLSMNEVPSWDSLSHMDLIVAIEDAFQIQLTGDDIADMISIENIRSIISRYTD
jgi:acyl carrier protein